MKSRITFAAILLTMAFVPQNAAARSHRVPQLPYGNNFGCTSCHTTPAGGGVFTGFGSDSILALVGADLLQERDLDWSQVYQLDSDRDGFTNGEEVNDPNGAWRIGNPNPVGGRVTNPGNANDHPPQICGDGRVTPPEECDGTNHREFTCVGLGLDEGVLTCRSDCSFDRTGCGPQPANNDPGTPPQMTNAGGETADDDAACSTSTGPVNSTPLFVFAIAALIVRRRG